MCDENTWYREIHPDTVRDKGKRVKVPDISRDSVYEQTRGCRDGKGQRVGYST